MVVDENYMAARFAELPDDELKMVVGKFRDDYTERALELAREELRRRGIEPTMEEPATGDAPSRKSEALSMSWANIYAATTGTSGAGSLFVYAVWGDHGNVRVAVLTAGSAALQLAVGIGLSRRRPWGWYLNLALLVGLSMTMCVIGVVFRAGFVVVPLVWPVLNGIYFVRRRKFFTGGAVRDQLT